VSGDGRADEHGSYSLVKTPAICARGCAGGVRRSAEVRTIQSEESNPTMRRIGVAFLVGSTIVLPPLAWAPAPAPPKPEGQPRGQAARDPRAAAKALEPGGEAKAVTQAILDEIDKHSELMANLEYLCDMIGPRLTGSAGLTKASQWTRDKFRQYGVSN